MAPDFAVITPEGLAGVSIREALLELTDAEFQSVEGMESTIPEHVVSQSMSLPVLIC